MPSPFPGMDPFIESQRWLNFHGSLLHAIAPELVSRLRPRYIVDVEEYVFQARENGEVIGRPEPDIAIAESEAGPLAGGGTAAGSAVAERPLVLTTPSPARRRRQKYLTLRRPDGEQVVTVIELLSPTNKAAGEGAAEYLAKRENVFNSGSNLVELDLLRGGLRLPTKEPLPSADYFAFVSRHDHRPRVEVHAWGLRRPLPPIPVPLADGDPDVVVDLQPVFTRVFGAAGYDYSLKYGREIDPPLSGQDREWVEHVLASAGVERHR